MTESADYSGFVRSGAGVRAGGPVRSAPASTRRRAGPRFRFAIADAVRVSRRWLLGVIVLEIPLQFDVYLYFRPDAAELGALPGAVLSATSVCVLLLYSLWGLEIGAGLTPFPRALIRQSLPFLCYVAVVSLSLLFAVDLGLAAFEALLLIEAFLVFFYIAHALRSRDDLLFVTRLLLAGLLLQGVIMVALWAVGEGVAVAGMQGHVDPDSGRVGGTLGSPINAAAYLVLVVVPALGVLAAHVRFQLKVLGLMAFGAGLAGLVVTASRGGWIGVVVGIGVLGLGLWRRGYLSRRATVTVGMVTLLTVGVSQGAIVERVTGDDGGSAYSRLPLMRIAADVIADHPLTGVGANNFIVVMKSYATGYGTWLHPVHNKYLLVWAETGTMGLFCFLLCLATILRRGWQTWSVQDRVVSPIALAFTAALMGNMLQMAVDSFASRPEVEMWWLVAGLLSASRRIV